MPIGIECVKNYNIKIRNVHFFEQGWTRLKVGTMQHDIPPRSGMVVEWSADQGWGQLTITKMQDGTIEIDSEHMSDDFVCQVMKMLTEYLLYTGTKI